jgi:hypothetical protein
MIKLMLEIPIHYAIYPSNFIFLSSASFILFLSKQYGLYVSGGVIESAVYMFIIVNYIYTF